MLIAINTMGRAGAEKSLIALLKSIDYSRVSVSLFAIIDRGELFCDVPREVHLLNRNPSPEPLLGAGGTFYVMKKVLSQLFRRGYIFKYLGYAAKNIAGQLKGGRFQLDKLLWLLLAETSPSPDETYDLALAFIEGGATYYVAERVQAKTKMSINHVNYQKAGYVRKLDRPFYEKMDYIACVSDSIKTVLETEIFPELADRMRIFPNLVDLDETHALSEAPGGFSDEFSGIRLLTVARLHPQKGLDVAIAAFAALVRAGYDQVRWYVLGDGAEKARLERLIQKHGMEGRFILLGSRPNPYPYIAQCDIYVQPSRYEGLSLTLLEALTLCRPCITTNFDGIPDLLHNGEDAVVIPFSEENITDALKLLIDNQVLRENIAAATKSLRFEFPNKTWVLYDMMDGNPWEE